MLAFTPSNFPIQLFRDVLQRNTTILVLRIYAHSPQVHIPNFGGLSGSEDTGGGDNSIQFINFGKVGDRSFEEWRQKIEGWKDG